MSKLLSIPRSLVYYHLNKEKNEENKEKLEKEELLEKEIKEIFRRSKNNYGTRKIKVELEKKGLIISRIMKKNSLISNYTVKQFKVEKTYLQRKEDSQQNR